MALVNDTLAAACAVSDKQIKVTTGTGFGPGYKIRIGDEDFKVTKGYVSGVIVPVLRGQDGTVAVAHPSGAQVTVGVSSDWTLTGAPQTVDSYPIAGRARVINEYSADGAIALPPAGADALAVISGTAHTGLTLANPTKDLNGSRLTIIDLTAAAHVVTIASGVNGGALATWTWDASGRAGVTFIAYNELWYLEFATGTFTGMDVVAS